MWHYLFKVNRWCTFINAMPVVFKQSVWKFSSHIPCELNTQSYPHYYILCSYNTSEQFFHRSHASAWHSFILPRVCLKSKRATDVKKKQKTINTHFTLWQQNTILQVVIHISTSQLRIVQRNSELFSYCAPPQKKKMLVVLITKAMSIYIHSSRLHTLCVCG